MRKLRLFVQCLTFALSNGYLKGFQSGKIYKGGLKKFCHPGLNCYSCPGALFSCPIGALQAVSTKAGFNISLYVLGFLFLIGTLFGRAVCGWICPFGLIQRLLYKIPIKNKKKNLKYHHALKYLKYLILLFCVILFPLILLDENGISSPFFCEYICPSGMLFGAIPLTLISSSLRSLIGSRFFIKGTILILVIFLSIKYSRPFCKYICPLGAIYSFFNPISIVHLKVDNTKCTRCTKCQSVCPMDIKVYEDSKSLECIRCFDCVSACEQDAIKIEV